MNNDRKYKIEQLLMKWYNHEKEMELVIHNQGINMEKTEAILKMIKRMQNKTVVSIQRFNKKIDKSVLKKYKNKG